jgi:tellurite resistance protein
MMAPMTPAEKNILKSLVAVAWADGKVEAPEAGVIEGLLCGFDASEQEEQEMLDYAKTRRTLAEGVPVSELEGEDRELLLANAALLTHADGEQSDTEKETLDKLIQMLGFSQEQANEIVGTAGEGALTLGSRSLRSLD